MLCLVELKNDSNARHFAQQNIYRKWRVEKTKAEKK